MKLRNKKDLHFSQKLLTANVHVVNKFVPFADSGEKIHRRFPFFLLFFLADGKTGVV